MSVINPESDVWQHIKVSRPPLARPELTLGQIPSTFIALHHPIRYAVISSDARLIAVAGRKGLTHYNALSGRWKLFENEREEASLVVCGGMAWWGNSLVVGCEEAGNYSVRRNPPNEDQQLTSRDRSKFSPGIYLSPSRTSWSRSPSYRSLISSPSSTHLCSSTRSTTRSTTISSGRGAIEREWCALGSDWGAVLDSRVSWASRRECGG